MEFALAREKTKHEIMYDLLEKANLEKKKKLLQNGTSVLSRYS